MKFRLSWQEEADDQIVDKEREIEADSREEADLWAARNIVMPMVETSLNIPFIYGSAKIEEVIQSNV